MPDFYDRLAPTLGQQNRYLLCELLGHNHEEYEELEEAQVIGPALHMLLSGNLFNAEEALRFGLVTKVAPPSELMSTVEALAQRIAEHPIEVLKATKEAGFTGRDMAAEQSEMYTRALMAPLRDSQTSREGITAYAERRRANYK